MSLNVDMDAVALMAEQAQEKFWASKIGHGLSKIEVFRSDLMSSFLSMYKHNPF